MSIITKEKNTKSAITSAEYKAFDQIIAKARQERLDAELPVIKAFKQMYDAFKGDGVYHSAREIRSILLADYNIDLSVHEIAGNILSMRDKCSRYKVEIKTDTRRSKTRYALVRPDGTVDFDNIKEFDGVLGYRFF